MIGGTRLKSASAGISHRVPPETAMPSVFEKEAEIKRPGDIIALPSVLQILKTGGFYFNKEV